MIKLITPKNGEVVCLQTALQKEFMAQGKLRDAGHRPNGEHWAEQQQYDRLYTGDDKTWPLPVCMSWSDEDNRSYFTIKVSKKPDMSNAKERLVKGCSFDFFNLETGVKYYWQVCCGNDYSDVNTFYVLLTTPRTLYIDGVANVRDLGGYRTKNGRVKEGMLYRGGCFEDLVDKSRELTPKGLYELCAIGIKTDVDIRAEAEKERQVTWELTKNAGFDRIGITLGEYDNIFTKENLRNSQADFIRLLADETKYPIYYHCWAGADRTGSFAFIIGALLGVDEQSLIDDYEFTSLSPQGTRNSKGEGWKKLMQHINEYKGDDIYQKTESFVTEYLGVEKSVIEKIREILIENI